VKGVDMDDWKDLVVRFSPLEILAVAAVGSVTFLVIAQASGFAINVLFFGLPVAAFALVFGLSKTRLFRTPATRTYHLALLAAVLFLSTILRLIVAFSASYYPDEYAMWSIFKTYPWMDVARFLQNYAQIAGPQRVHPPAGVLLMSLAYSMTHTLEGARLVSVIVGLLSLPVAYWLVLNLSDRWTALYSTLMLSLLPQTVIFLSLALTDAYVFLFGLLSLAAFVSALKNQRTSYLVASGILLGLALWSKAVIPLLWAFAILLSALFSGLRPKREGLTHALSCFVIGGAMYGLWYLVSPISYSASISPLVRVLLLQRLNIGSVAFFPAIANAQRSTIGVFDLFSQLPAWFTPLTLVFGTVGVYISLKAKDRRRLWIALWALVPLLGSMIYYRDIRYLLVISIPILILAMSGTRLVPRRNMVLATLIVFLGVGSISFLPVAQQQYAGVREASVVLNSLQLSDQVILTNAAPLRLFLPQAKVIYLASYNSTKSVLDRLNSELVCAAIIVHQARGAWGGIPSPEVMQLLRGYFPYRTVGGPSDFSWYEIFYSHCTQNSAPTRAHVHDMSVMRTETRNPRVACFERLRAELPVSLTRSRSIISHAEVGRASHEVD
jgi:4-amino-4-deoxy-L-arabinose transferase-like glycosyltransferase